MRYIVLYLIVSIALILCASLLAKKIAGRRKMGKGKRALLAIGMSLLAITIYNVGYLQFYHHGDETAAEALQGNGAVQVTPMGEDYLFDGPGEEKVLVFIPGARVEETAYAPLLTKIAENGVDCFLVKMPMHMASFGLSDVDRVVGHYDYDEWYVAGHSLGGIMAAYYTEQHPKSIDGLILLAAYPTEKVPDSVRLLSIYGEEDGCLAFDRYEECKANWPAESSETIIEGGNHSKFGNYGQQRGDEEGSVSAEKQQTETVEAIIDFIK